MDFKKKERLKKKERITKNERIMKKERIKKKKRIKKNERIKKNKQIKKIEPIKKKGRIKVNERIKKRTVNVLLMSGKLANKRITNSSNKIQFCSSARGVLNSIKVWVFFGKKHWKKALVP